MGRAERPRGEDGTPRVGETGDAVYRARGDRLVIVERREDRLECPSEHRLARPGRADEEDVVAARRGDLERTLGGLLTRDVREVDRVRWGGGPRRNRRRGNADATLQVLHDGTERCETKRVDTARGRLTRVRIGDEHLADAAHRGVTNARHRPPNRAQRTIQRQLAETERGDVHPELPARAKDPESDRELEPGPFFAALGRGEVHRDPTERELEAGIADRGAHALARFLHRGVGQTHHDEGRQAVRDVDLDRDERGLEAPQRARGDARDGARGRWPVRRRDRDGEGSCTRAGVKGMGPSGSTAVLPARAD
jgi:hypothetical protein